MPTSRPKRQSHASVAPPEPDSPGPGGGWEPSFSRKTWAIGAFVVFVALFVAIAFLQSPTGQGLDWGVARWAFDAGVAHDKDGKLDLAIERYDRAIALDPGHAEAYNNRGTGRRRKGDLDGAIADYGEVIRLRPDSPVGYHNRGVIRQLKGDAEAALSDLALAVRQGQAKVEELKLDSGNFYRRLNRELTWHGNLRAAYLAQARSLAHTGRYEQAIASLDAAIAVGDNSFPSEAHFERARVRLLQGEFAEAAAEFDRFIAGDNGFKSGALMYRGFIALFHANDPKAALRDLEGAIKEGLIGTGTMRHLLDGSGPWLSNGMPMYPDGHELVIWQFFARERNGQWGLSVLEENVKQLAARLGYVDIWYVAPPAGVARALADWPGPVIEMLLRTKTPAAPRAAAEAADEKLRARRTCEADFYTGLFRMKSAPAPARVLLQRAAENCPPGTIAGLGARLEVGRFGSAM